MKAIDLITAADDAVKHEKHAQQTRDKINTLLQEKQKEISEKIIDRLLTEGSHKSNLKVSTHIVLSKAIVYIRNWNYNVEYRNGDMEISDKDLDILVRIRLSEMNMVFDIIKEVLNEEGLS